MAFVPFANAFERYRVVKLYKFLGSESRINAKCLSDVNGPMVQLLFPPTVSHIVSTAGLCTASQYLSEFINISIYQRLTILLYTYSPTFLQASERVMAKPANDPGSHYWLWLKFDKEVKQVLR